MVLCFSLGYQRAVLAKLDVMAEAQQEALSLLKMLVSATRGIAGNDMLEDVIPNPVNEVESLEDLSSKLDDEQFKKKMVSVHCVCI